MKELTTKWTIDAHVRRERDYAKKLSKKNGPVYWLKVTFTTPLTTYSYVRF